MKIKEKAKTYQWQRSVQRLPKVKEKENPKT